MKVLQINVTLNTGSTGRIVEDIGKKILDAGGESYVGYGRGEAKSNSVALKIGNKLDQVQHLLQTRIFDSHGFGSRSSTAHFLQEVRKIDPDIIHLHNLHGYYLNVEVLFEFLASFNKPVLWTLHDCWPFTGHCCYFERAKCEKWKTACYECPLKFLYPQSYLKDNSRRNFIEKKRLFNLPRQIQITAVSKWLATQASYSFLGNYPISTIYNGVDLSVFKPMDVRALRQKHNISSDTKIILGVANAWSEGKGLKAFIELSKLISKNQQIILIGLTERQTRELPDNIIPVARTESISELAQYYNMADVFVSPSMAETFGMVIAEAMSCGTPAVVYKSSAMPELIDTKVGHTVIPGDYAGLNTSIQNIILQGKNRFSTSCTTKAKKLFDKEKQFDKYVALYKQLLYSFDALT